MDNAWIALISAFVGGLITAIPTVIIAILNNREQRKRELLSGAIQAGLAEWKEHKEMAVRANSMGHNVSFPPVATYFVSSYLTLQAIDQSKTEDEIKKDIAEAIRLTGVINNLMNDPRRNQNQSSETTD